MTWETLDNIDGWQWVAAVATWLITLTLSVIVGSWVVPWVLRRAGRGDLPWARYKPPVYPQALEAEEGEGAAGEGTAGEGIAGEGAGGGGAGEGSPAAGTQGAAGTESAAEKSSGSDSGAATGASGAMLPGPGKAGAGKSGPGKSGSSVSGASNARQVPDGEESPTGTMHPDAVAILRGGAWLGVLERLAITGSLLAGYPYGIAIVVAIKGLGRYAELRDQPVASERFVVGTLASLIWSVATGLLGLVVLNALVL
ncbi:hypothetical protein [Promicromonospora kroppenstedtii]|uniref:hypothetical protein n=1 Tax=Promicromonospora kroppenstedtii TaxID=440482 RepID=UPI0004BCB128